MMRFDQTMKDAEDNYAAYREANPEHFVVNETSGDWTLHRARCPHLGPFNAYKAELVRNPKACSDKLAELEEHASKHGKSLRNCSNSHCL